MHRSLRDEVHDELRLAQAFLAGLVLAGAGPAAAPVLSWLATFALIAWLARGTRPLFAAAIGGVVELWADFSLRRPEHELHADRVHLVVLLLAVGVALLVRARPPRPRLVSSVEQEAAVDPVEALHG